jgi:hypothetical protein
VDELVLACDVCGSQLGDTRFCQVCGVDYCEECALGAHPEMHALALPAYKRAKERVDG